MHPLINNKIYASKSPIHGWGAFASEDISSGEIVEECPVIKMDEKFSGLPSEIKRYAFSWKYGLSQKPCIVMGYGGVYNHSDNNNLEYYTDEAKDVMVYKASRDIKAGEELFVNYGPEYFQMHGIEKK